MSSLALLPEVDQRAFAEVMRAPIRSIIANMHHISKLSKYKLPKRWLEDSDKSVCCIKNRLKTARVR